MIDLKVLPMRIALGQTNELSDEYLMFACQCGMQDVQMNTPKLPGDERWEEDDLRRQVERAAEYGLRLIALENVPVRFYDEIMLNGPGRERQLGNMQATVRNMGKAGIPILGYHWMPNGVWRTNFEVPIRGGAISNQFRYAHSDQTKLTHGREYTAEEMWANYHWYMERILPVCEKAGVHMALHPDDPPVPTLGGVARIFHSFDGFCKALDAHPSPMHGLDFCHGCWSEMRAGEGVLEAIDHFGSRGQILYVHMRDVQGCADDFTECFINEGNSSVVAVMRKLKAVGFRGFILDDHVPRMVNDSPWCHRGRAHATGYLTGVLDAVLSE